MMEWTGWCEKLFSFGNVGIIPFAFFWGFKLQLVTICNCLVSLFFKFLFQNLPVVVGIGTLCQYNNYINDREVLFFFLFVPGSADKLIFKKLQIFSIAHDDFLLASATMIPHGWVSVNYRPVFVILLDYWFCWAMKKTWTKCVWEIVDFW